MLSQPIILKPYQGMQPDTVLYTTHINTHSCLHTPLWHVMSDDICHTDRDNFNQFLFFCQISTVGTNMIMNQVASDIK